MTIGRFPITDRYLLDVAVLAKEFFLAQSLEELIFANGGYQTCHVNKVLLNDTHSLEIFATFLFGLALLNLFLTLLRRSLLLVLLDVGSKLCLPAPD